MHINLQPVDRVVHVSKHKAHEIREEKRVRKHSATQSGDAVLRSMGSSSKFAARDRAKHSGKSTRMVRRLDSHRGPLPRCLSPSAKRHDSKSRFKGLRRGRASMGAMHVGFQSAARIESCWPCLSAAECAGLQLNACAHGKKKTRLCWF